MKRLMFVMVMAVVMVVSTDAMAGTARAVSRERFRDGYVYRNGWSVYGYDYWPMISRGPAGYPSRSLFDLLTGETDRKALEIMEKDQDFRQEQERRAEDKEILAWAAQRVRAQKLEEENQRLKEKIAGLEAQKKEDENRQLRERIAEMEKQATAADNKPNEPK